MDTLLHDFRYALRALRRAPGFALVAVLTLALGIGANTAIFSVVNGVLLKPLPFAEPDRLVTVWGSYPQTGRTSTSLPDFLDYREQATVFSELAAVVSTSSNLAVGGGEPERVERAFATANFFATLGVRPAAGRFFLPEEEIGAAETSLNAQPVVVVSHRLWQSQFGGAASIVGTTVSVHGTPATVVGVAPAGFRYGHEVDVWSPLNVNATRARRSELLQVLGRVRPGVEEAQVRAELVAINRRLAEQYPETNETIGVEAVSLHDHLVGDLRPALLAFVSAVGLVLLIACANVASLMLTRAAGREREMAIRAALGAGRHRIVRQLLTESVVLALIGGAVGVAIAAGGIAALRGAEGELIPRFAEVAIDLRVLAFTFGLATLSGVLFGLMPALQLGRQAVGTALRSGGRGMAGQRGVRRVRGGLVLGEVALALMLLVGAGLLIRSFDRMQRIDAGFDPSGVLSARVVLPLAQYPEETQRVAFFDRLLERLGAVPGVQVAAIGSNVPLSGSAGYLALSIEGVPDAGPDVMQDAHPFAVSPDYFAALRIPLIAGRPFGEQDHADAPLTAIVNRTLVDRFLGDLDPIGRRITLGNPEDPEAEWLTIVGVVEDTRVLGLREAPYPQVFGPLAQGGNSSVVMLLRTAGDPARLSGSIREAVRGLDPTLPVFDVKTMEQYTAESIAQPRIGTALLGIFAAVALLLAAVGIYGLISHSVAQRTREIGVRLALGAQPRDVLVLMVREGMAPAAAGIAVGAFGAWAASRLIRGMLFGVSASDPLTFLTVVAFLSAVALLAAYLPARRATRVDPIVALRTE